jgi:hypothetical protein
MKKLTFTLAISLLAFAFTAKSQNCASSFFPNKEGTKMETTSYDKNNKEQSKSTTTIVSIKQSGAATIINLKAESTDAKKNVTTTEFSAKCEGDNYSMSMKGFIPADMQKSSGETSMTIDASDMVFPNNISVGQKLSDGSATLTMAMGAMTMTTEIKMINRKVTAKESLTTPAGTYDCFKIEYDIETAMMGMKVKSKAAMWLAKGVGTVKTQTFDEKGQLLGYSLLTSVK